jgi:VWFA-related protein
MAHARTRRSWAALAVGALVPAVLVGASDQAKEPKPHEFGTSTYQVSVDFVAHDRQGHGIEDLTPAEVEVYEDGIRQDVESLRLVHRPVPGTGDAAAVTTPQGTAGPAVVPPDGPELIAVVLDNISTINRGAVRQRLREYFKDHWREGQQVGVFAVGDRLAVAQPFTSDKAALLEGVERAFGWHGTLELGRPSDGGVIRAVNARLPGTSGLPFGNQDRPPGMRGPEGAPSANLPAPDGELRLIAALARDIPSMTTIYSLLAVVKAMSAARGRKAIVFMSDEFRLDPHADLLFPSLVTAANEAQVSIYSVDAAGLRIDSANTRLQQDMGLAAADHPEGRVLGGRPDQAGDAFLASVPRALFQVADSTGGAVVQDTNNLALGLEKADQDLGDYYLLSYSPKNENFDGRFREIQVRIRRAHGDLRARRGYLALRTRSWADPVLAYESPALSRLEKNPTADQFTVHAQALVFPTGSTGSVTAILVELRGGAMRLEVEKKAGLFHQDFSIVAIVRDASGIVVRKLSQYYPLKGSLDKLEQAKRNKVLFYKETDLPPGTYAVEVVAYDNRAGAASVRRMALEVPEPGGERLQASSLVLVEHAEEAGGQGHRSAPLVVKGVQLYPSLDAAVPRTESGEAEFFLRAWPAAGHGAVDAAFELRRGDQVVAAHRLGQLAVDETGEINMLTGVSVSEFPPGPYKVRVTLRDGQDVASRSVDLTIAADAARNP